MISESAPNFKVKCLFLPELNVLKTGYNLQLDLD